MPAALSMRALARLAPCNWAREQAVAAACSRSGQSALGVIGSSFQISRL